MSYCRASNQSDVYIHPRTHGTIVCVGCSLDADENVGFATREAALMHLIDHRVAGHKVPNQAFRKLLEEIRRGNQ